MANKAYSYVRFSTPEQELGDSRRRQLQLAADYASRHGLKLDDKLTFHDLGVSAFRGQNVEAGVGKLGAFLEAVRNGSVERGSYLLVESLDRISRLAARKAMTVLSQICDEGITVVTLTDGRQYDTASLDTDPTSLLMSLLIFIRANEESVTKGRRVAAAWQAKRAAAEEKPLTAKCPGWLKLDPEEGRFVVLKDRAKIVERIFRLTARGVGQHSIASTFNEEKVPTFGDAAYWHRSYVKKVLLSPAVRGQMVPHTIEYKDGKKRRQPQKPVENYFPAIIKPDLYKRVHALVAGTSKGVRNPRRGRHAHAALSNVLGGLARCPVCGGSITLVNKGRDRRGKSRGNRYLVCTKAKAGAGCAYHATVYETVEATLVRDAKRIVDGCPSDREKGRKLRSELEHTDQRIDAELAGIERLLDELQRGRTPSITARLATAESKLQTLKEKREELLRQSEAASGPVLKARLGELKDTLTTTPLDRERANVLLRGLMTGVKVDWREGALSFEWAHGGVSELPYEYDFPSLSAVDRKALKRRAK